MGGHVARMEERTGIYRVLVRKTKGKRPLGRTKCRWEDKIKMGLQELGRGYGLNLSGSRYGQIAGCCECGNEPSGSIQCGEFFDQLGNG